MKKQSSSRFVLIYNIILVISVILAGISLISGALVIYFSGNGYSREIVTKTFSKISIPVYISIALIIGNLFVKSSSKKRFQKPENFNQTHESIFNSNKISIIKISIVLLAITSLIIGVIAGGMSDVLTKAVNICTECIGLG